MNRTLGIGAVVLSVLAALMSAIALRRSSAPVQPIARLAGDDCDVDNWWVLTTCLLPSSDVRHDPSTQLSAGVDCYWERQSWKWLYGHASSGSVPFHLAVSNHCTNQVDVKLYLEPSELAFLSADCGLANAAGAIDFGTLGPSRPSASRTCFTERYPYGAGMPPLSRTFRIVAEKVDSTVISVEADPEIVLERDGTVSMPPNGPPGPPAPPADPPR